MKNKTKWEAFYEEVIDFNYLFVLMRTRLLAAFNGLPSLYQTTAGTGLPLVRQRSTSLCCFFTVTDSSSPYATGDRAVQKKKRKKKNTFKFNCFLAITQYNSMNDYMYKMERF